MKRWSGLFKKVRRRSHRSRSIIFEALEDRRVLNGIPLAGHDSRLSTALNTALAVSGANALLANDWDPEGSSLSASVVANPSNGALSNFNSSTGSFTYTPNNGFTGIDTFTYKVNDGTDDSNVATVSIAVGGHFGPRTNTERRSIRIRSWRQQSKSLCGESGYAAHRSERDDPAKLGTDHAASQRRMVRWQPTS